MKTCFPWRALMLITKSDSSNYRQASDCHKGIKCSHVSFPFTKSMQHQFWQIYTPEILVTQLNQIGWCMLVSCCQNYLANDNVTFNVWLTADSISFPFLLSLPPHLCLFTYLLLFNRKNWRKLYFDNFAFSLCFFLNS